MSAAISLSALGSSDLDWLLAIETRAREEGFIRGNDRAGHEQHMAGSQLDYLKIRAGDEPVGYLILSGVGDPDGVVELGRIVIDEAHRGIGQAALAHIIDYIFGDLSAHKIYLDTLGHNLRGQHIYEKLGFVQEGKLREAFLLEGRRYDMIIYGLLETEWRKP